MSAIEAVACGRVRVGACVWTCACACICTCVFMYMRIRLRVRINLEFGIGHVISGVEILKCLNFDLGNEFLTLKLINLGNSNTFC